MSYHIGAEEGQIAETVLLPGDPLRAKFIADLFLEDVFCYSEVRNMFGFTGTYKGHRISVQGAGMGIPSTAIYTSELIDQYKIKKLIRVGTCGSIQSSMGLNNIVLAMGASTDSSINEVRFNKQYFAPTADFELLTKAHKTAEELNMEVSIGGIYSTDSFYLEDEDRWNVWAKHGVLGVEMESAVLYTLAIGARVKALSILTVSDNILTGETSSKDERQSAIKEISHLALETAIA